VPIVCQFLKEQNFELFWLLVVRPVRFPGEANSLFLFSKRSKDAMVHLIQSNEFVSGLKPILFFLKVKVSVFGGEGSFGLKSQYFFGHVVETIH
jgi:hypothetical protein